MNSINNNQSVEGNTTTQADNDVAMAENRRGSREAGSSSGDQVRTASVVRREHVGVQARRSFSDEHNRSNTGRERGIICDGGNMCVELALEGERLCKIGDCSAGVAFFQAAIEAGTEDMTTLSAIYSQLGNAYFFLGDYDRAIEYHKHDLTITRSLGDKVGEAKSYGNLGNTLKVMGRYDEAVLACERHLSVARELEDKTSEGRALYNLGNIYHAKAKHLGSFDDHGPGEFSQEVKECLIHAIDYYKKNLALMKEMQDIAAEGRACGNLGNTNYLLGKFREAVYYHSERLRIAIQFGDKCAERRANSNLGNSHIFLGEFDKAAEYYKRSIVLAKELRDKTIEAQACYCLGNAYTLLHDYTRAIEQHLQHFLIARQLKDRVGEGRACWSLGNAYTSLGNYEKALVYTKEHLKISRKLNDTLGQATAHVNIVDLQKILNLPTDVWSKETEQLVSSVTDAAAKDVSSPGVRRYRVRRKSMEKLDLIKLTPLINKGSLKDKDTFSTPTRPSSKGQVLLEKFGKDEEEEFFDLVSRFQSERMDDQRCALEIKPSTGRKISSTSSTDPQDDLIDMIMGVQGRRMNDQRASFPGLIELTLSPSKTTSKHRPSHSTSAPAPDEDDRLIGTGKSTVPDEDFFSLIVRLQSGRMDDQRAQLRTTK